MRRGDANGVEEDKDEFEVEEFRNHIISSQGSRFKLITNEFGLRWDRRRFVSGSVMNGIRGFSKDFVINPDNRYYHIWTHIILIWAVYSSFLTPIEFGFFRGLPKALSFLDITGQVAFLIDIVVNFFLAYRDSETYLMVYKRTPIALRYLKSNFIFDFLGCLPWDVIYRVSGRKEVVRYLLWLRLTRVRKMTDFFQKMEKDIRINYLFTRIVKLIAVELYCTHTAACIFYYLATTLPPSHEGYTWIGSLKLGDYSYSNFREIDLGKRYLTSLYFAIVTMATVGCGDIHAVNIREMIFVMIYVSFDMIIGAYLIGNMTALIVKGSKTERFRDKMTDMIKYMNRNKLGKDIRDQIKGHLRLQYESSYTEASVLQDIPISIRAKISQRLYKSYVENASLFKGCSAELINQIVIRIHEEYFLPGEVIMEQGSVVDQVYFVCHGVLEEIGIGEDGSEETVSLLQPNSSFGELSILCNIPQPYTVRVCELCRLLRLDKQSFTSVLDIFFYDGRKILSNLLEGKESKRVKQIESDITYHIGKQEADLALKVNSASYNGDLYQLKSLIRSGGDPNKTDYDGRSPLHLAASKGYEDITLFLIQEGVDVNISDNFGNTPLFEAIKNGHDRVVSLLVKEGASLKIDNAGNFLCAAVARGDLDYLKRLLSNGIDPDSMDYSHQTPLHVASADGLYLMAKLLIEAGASVLLKDRFVFGSKIQDLYEVLFYYPISSRHQWGHTPLDEGRKSGNKNLIKLLEEAKSVELRELGDCSQINRVGIDDATSILSEICFLLLCLSPYCFFNLLIVTHLFLKTDDTQRKQCNVFPFHPWDPKEKRNRESCYGCHTPQKS
ncbi:hypothetical protein IFM89_020829 [Coptis chinensis]|uniref:Potassium channel n=1 Tax=Coptis chinensis TaxID=261450 RepID=A0A835J153_9MAGN|nr:hypothetical protein IFM89_020829 [Coptis chinensis]